MKMRKQTFLFDNVYLVDVSTITGPKENLGPLKNKFDYSFSDLHINANSWEQAEENLLKEAIKVLLKKTGVAEEEIDCLVSGDLINQNVISNYVLRDFNIPFLGIYGACSNIALGLITGAFLLNKSKYIITSSSSHYGDAERQFRNPTEYGGAKAVSSTTTVTGSCAFLLTSDKKNIRIESVTIGRVIDSGYKNSNDMGGAMAPAAYETIKAHINDLDRKIDYYDLVLTGDLSKVGTEVLLTLLANDNIEAKNIYDAGLSIYDIDNQEVFSGGSGCACIGLVFGAKYFPMLKRKEIKRILLIGTGALLNPLIMYQKETICSIAHAVSLEVVN